MLRNIDVNTKCMSVDASDDYRTISQLCNPYYYNFGRAKKEHCHSCDFQKLHYKVNLDYFNNK